MSHVRNSEACVQPPLVIYGVSGSGKTALMCKAFELLRQSASTDGHHVLVLRLLGTSPQSSEIHDVLKSICYQVGSLRLLLTHTKVMIAVLCILMVVIFFLGMFSIGSGPPFFTGH